MLVKVHGNRREHVYSMLYVLLHFVHLYTFVLVGFIYIYITYEVLMGLFVTSMLDLFIIIYKCNLT